MESFGNFQWVGNFGNKMVNSLKVLEPIASAITEIEGAQAILSDVQRLLSELGGTVGATLPQTPLLKPEERAVLGFLEKCQEFCLKPIQAAAYMLDPKCHHQPTLSLEQIDAAYVMASLAKFRSKNGLWKGAGVWASAEHITAATWWQGLCASEGISPIASVILQIPPTSAASECNWSLFGNTHTKVRNRLTNDRVEKLLAIRSNLKLFEPSADVSTQLDYDSEVDEMVVGSSTESGGETEPVDCENK